MLALNRAQPTPKRSFRQLCRRLDQAGLELDFVRTALLPDWWGREHDKDEALLPEAEFAVSRFLGSPLEEVRDPTRPLAVPEVHAKLRRAKGVDASELAASMYAAMAVAGAVCRNLKGVGDYRPLPEDPLEWREELLSVCREAITLKGLVGGLWERGVPVVHIGVLPGKKFRGMACHVEGRPVVLLAWKTNEAPKLLGDAAHEAGHIASGHVAPDRPMLDADGSGLFEEDGEGDEKQANVYFRKLLLGEHMSFDASSLWSGNPKLADGNELAKRAREKAKALRVDAGLLVHYWAVKTNAYQVLNYTLKRLWKFNGREILQEYMSSHVDFAGASDSDAGLLRCVARNETGDR